MHNLISPGMVLVNDLNVTSEQWVHDDLLTMVKKTESQMVWPHLKIFWHGEDNSARDSERSKKERKTEEEMGR